MPEPSHLPPGTVIADKYSLEGLLGEGGMGAVYQATNLAIGRRVAIKILNAAVADREDIRRRFELEAKAAAVISHPGIVDVLDMGQTDVGEPFIVMEHLEGATLRSIAKELHVLTVPQAVGVMLPVLDALHAAHRAGVVHRDVKPANVFVCAKPPVVKLLDFGVSRFGGSSGLTNSGTAVGTPRYMAPEQVLGEEDLGPEADLYSVGAVLYSLLSGKLPHGTGADMAVLARILHDTPAPLIAAGPTLPLPLCELVDSLLLKDRSLRPRDAAEVKDRLVALVPNADMSELYAVATRRARAASIAPTPSLVGISSPPSSRKITPKSRKPEEAKEDTRGVTVDLRHGHRRESSNASLMAGIVAGALVLGAASVGGYLWFTRTPTVASVVPLETIPSTVTPDRAVPIIVTLTVEPSNARIVVGGVPLSCNPCEVSGVKGTRQGALISAPGMSDATVELLFDRDRTERVVLAAAVAVEAAPDAGKVVRKKKPTGGLSVDEKNPYQ